MWTERIQKHSERMLRRSTQQKALKELKRAGKQTIKDLKVFATLPADQAAKSKAKIFENLRRIKRNAQGKETFDHFKGDLFK